MALEDGLDPLDEDFNWNLGGLMLGEGAYGVVGDEGLEGVETEHEEGDAAGDGASMGTIRVPSRPVTLYLNVVPDGATQAERDAAIDVALHDLGLVINPLPDRAAGQRMLRFRRRGGLAKRLYYRAANGEALSIAGDEARIKYAHADVVVRLDCADPVILSDEYTDYVLVAGESEVIENVGNHIATMPVPYELTGSGTTRLRNLTYPDGDITFPSTGALSVKRAGTTMEIAAAGGTYGICHGPNNVPFPNWPLLYPGDNEIVASANCTLRVWSTWL